MIIIIQKHKFKKKPKQLINHPNKYTKVKYRKGAIISGWHQYTVMRKKIYEKLTHFQGNSS